MPKKLDTLTADDLYETLAAIHKGIQENKKPDGTCSFDMQAVYIYLITALGFIDDPEKRVGSSA